MADIVIAEFMDEAAVADLARAYDVFFDAALVERPQELLRRVANARALVVRNRTQVRGALLDAGARLLCVGRLGVGLDNIDVQACEARGIAVFPATGANDVSVVEYVIAAAMLLLRGAFAASGDVAAGQWPRMRLMGREIAGRRLGIIGFGAIGRALAGRAAALGMDVGAFDPLVAAGDPAWDLAERMDLDSLLAVSDVVSLHVPLTDATQNLIDARALGLMRSDAVLINAARGGVLDEGALCVALRDGRLAGAALDVFAAEPMTAESGKAFAGVPNLILTPHIAGVTRESNVRIGRLVAEKVAGHLAAGRRSPPGT
ncbi:MAG: hydroxyacid dehydrogenase [Propylenella sp.]